MVNKVVQRFLYTTNRQLANKFENRQSNIINKLIHGRQKGKKVWYNSEKKLPTLTSATSFVQPSNGGGKQSLRRINVLNKLFMKNITDLMATGSVSEDLLGRQLEISQVKVTSDFQLVNVFWVTKGIDDDNIIQKMLDNAAIPLRHELSQLRVMGQVPRINFIKDKQYAKVVEVEKLLAVADFGCTDDLEDSDLNLVASPKSPSIYDNLPLMRQDLFDLDRGMIMEKIMRNMKKTNQSWEKYEYGRCREKTVSVESDQNNNNTFTLSNVEKSIQNSQSFQQYLESKKTKNIKDIPDRKKYRAEKEIVYNEIGTIEHQELEDYLYEDEQNHKNKI